VYGTLRLVEWDIRIGVCHVVMGSTRSITSSKVGQMRTLHTSPGPGFPGRLSLDLSCWVVNCGSSVLYSGTSPWLDIREIRGVTYIYHPRVQLCSMVGTNNQLVPWKIRSQVVTCYWCSIPGGGV
jgi:hypothetical protein